MLSSMIKSALTIGELLKTKGHETWSISPHASAYKALEIMSEKEVGALLVVDDDALNSAAEIQDAFNDYRKTQFGGWPWSR